MNRHGFVSSSTCHTRPHPSRRVSAPSSLCHRVHVQALLLLPTHAPSAVLPRVVHQRLLQARASLRRLRPPPDGLRPTRARHRLGGGRHGQGGPPQRPHAARHRPSLGAASGLRLHRVSLPRTRRALRLLSPSPRPPPSHGDGLRARAPPAAAHPQHRPVSVHAAVGHDGAGGGAAVLRASDSARVRRCCGAAWEDRLLRRAVQHVRRHCALSLAVGRHR